MSAPAAPAPNPPAPAVPDEGFTPINFSEIEGTPPSVEPAPTPKPAVSTVETPAPVDLFAMFKPQAEPEPTPQPEPQPASDETPTEIPEGERGAPAVLRAELAKRTKEYKELEARFQQEIADRDHQLQELNGQFDDFRREVSVTDPSLSPEVVAAQRALDAQIGKTVKTLPPKEARALISKAKVLVDEYAALGNINDAGYDERYEALRGKLTKDFGAYSDNVMQQLPNLEEYAQKIKDAVRNAGNISTDVLSERAVKTHKDGLALFEASIENTLTASEELAQAQPFATRNVISAMIQSVPEFKETSDRLVKFLRTGMVPPAPLSKEAEMGMTPEQRQQAIQQQMASYQHASTEIFQNAPLAYHAAAVVPTLARMYNELLGKYNALVDSSPSETHRSGPAPSNPKPSDPAPPNGIRPISITEITG